MDKKTLKKVIVVVVSQATGQPISGVVLTVGGAETWTSCPETGKFEVWFLCGSLVKLTARAMGLGFTPASVELPSHKTFDQMIVELPVADLTGFASL